jgi:microcystin-dependent protein
MSEVFIGVMQPFAFQYAPRNWKICDGSLLPIAQYQTLFSLIGTTYGGNGTTNFAIPDTRGRILLGQGRLPGGSTYTIGESSGSEAVTLTVQNLPMHMHLLMASMPGATAPAPGSNEWLSTANGSDPTSGDAVTVQVYAPAGPAQPLQGVAAAGGNGPAPIMQPFLVNNYCIAVLGIFPSRN